MKRVFVLLWCVFVLDTAFGQYVALNDSIHSFGNQIAALLEGTNNAEAAAFGQEFNALWPNSFSTEQQQQIIEIAITIQERKLSSIPFHRDFFGALTLGVNLTGLSGAKLDNFLSMLRPWIAIFIFSLADGDLYV